MFDTFILAMKKKPLTFLQIYHHITIILCVWTWFESGWSVSWYVPHGNTSHSDQS